MAFVTGVTPDKWARVWAERSRRRLELIPVDAAGQRFLIDDATEFGEAVPVRVAVPASALHLFPA